MGNSCGGLSEFIDSNGTERYSGFIWDYIVKGLSSVCLDANVMRVGGDWATARPTTNSWATASYSPTAPPAQGAGGQAAVFASQAHPRRHGVTIENRNLFASTDGYVFAARLLEDDADLHADCRFDVAAGDTQHHDIAFPGHRLRRGTREVTYEVDLLISQRPPRGHPPATNSPSDNSPTPSTPQGHHRTTKTMRRPRDGHSADGTPASAATRKFMSRTQEASSPKRNGRNNIRRPEIAFRPLTDNDRGNAPT